MAIFLYFNSNVFIFVIKILTTPKLKLINIKFSYVLNKKLRLNCVYISCYNHGFSFSQRLINIMIFYFNNNWLIPIWDFYSKFFNLLILIYYKQIIVYVISKLSICLKSNYNFHHKKHSSCNIFPNDKMSLFTLLLASIIRIYLSL